MIWKLQQVLNYGTGTPAVARTVLQGKDIVPYLNGTQEQQEAAMSVLFELQYKLIRCVTIHDEISSANEKVRIEVTEGKIGVKPGESVLRLPSVDDLQNKAESFLQAAKLSIAQATRLTEAFYGKDFGHKLNKLAEWAQKEFGEQHLMSRCAVGWQPWVKHILEMRNAIDHPRKGPKGRLHVRNFHAEEEDEQNKQSALIAPQWWLEGEDMTPIAGDMGAIIEGVIRLYEDILTSLFLARNASPILELQEIPEDQRNPVCPIRLRVGITGHTIVP